MKVGGERVTTSAGGFNPTYQRHVAAYALAAAHLVPGRTLDLGCGVGHSRKRLGDRFVVGLDLDEEAVRRHGPPALRADMRWLPLRPGAFASVFSCQSIEHVPDPTHVVAEVARVLDPNGVAVIVTPNRLTFGRGDEVVDPYHFFELDAAGLRELVRPCFADIELLGLFGSPRYLEIYDDERRRLHRVLRLDPLRVRRFVPRRVRQFLYDLGLDLARRREAPGAAAIGPEDFELRTGPLDESLDLVAICRRPLSERERRPPNARTG